MAATTPYDEVRYSNFPYAQTHPDRLATVATLHGLAPADPAACRVLELGCGAGGNLMAMATATPGIRAVGIDLASGPIEEGRRAVAEVGLDNVELRQGDVLDLTEGQLGQFDYVIAHGVYAWVPPAVRDAVMAAAKSHLAPGGVGYISYNANPGGYFRRIMRDVGLWFARDAPDPLARVAKAQELYAFLLENRANERGDPWGSVLANALPILLAGPTYRLVHDDLAEHWDPVWVSGFAAHAERHGLAFVGDADLRQLLPDRVPAELEGPLRELAGGDRVAYEQHVDLLLCVFFRQSLVCHAGQDIDPVLDPERMRGLAFAARAGDGEPPAGLLADAHEILRARAPETVGFDALREALGAEPRPLADALLAGFAAELLMPHAAPLRVAGAGGERPAASPLARWQATRGPDVTSLAYANVNMEEPAARLLLTLLDGERDRDAIRREFEERTGVPLGAEDLDANLEQLARLFLLYDPGER